MCRIAQTRLAGLRKMAPRRSRATVLERAILMAGSAVGWSGLVCSVFRLDSILVWNLVSKRNSRSSGKKGSVEIVTVFIICDAV